MTCSKQSADWLSTCRRKNAIRLTSIGCKGLLITFRRKSMNAIERRDESLYQQFHSMPVRVGSVRRTGRILGNAQLRLESLLHQPKLSAIREGLCGLTQRRSTGVSQ